jgi:hypothetical protein
MSDTALPKPFQELEKFVSEWALPTEVERNLKRRSSSMETLEGFYDAVIPRWGEIMEHLKGVPVSDLPPEERRLLDLSLTFVEVSNAVERFGQPDVPDSCDASALVTVEGVHGVAARNP